MGTSRDFLASALADSLLPLLRRSMEDTVYETLDQRQVPTRTDFKEVRDLVNGLRGQVGGTTKGIERVVARLSELEARLQAIEDALANGAVAGAAPKTCQVADCTGDIRSKGLCGRHYQQWRRGRLPDYRPPK